MELELLVTPVSLLECYTVFHSDVMNFFKLEYYTVFELIILIFNLGFILIFDKDVMFFFLT